jgi:hypothetical protein
MISQIFLALENYSYVGDIATFLVRRYFCFTEDICNNYHLFTHCPVSAIIVALIESKEILWLQKGSNGLPDKS